MLSVAPSGFSDAVEGHNTVHTASCDQGFSYKIQRTINYADARIQESYINRFQPNGFLKVWIR